MSRSGYGDPPTPGGHRHTFLTAEWRYLAMLNYRVDPSLLADHVPAGAELDDRHGATYVSIVGFLFRDTQLLGISVPWHRHFEELNLRFYVRRTDGGEVRRGVTFIRELVPRRAIATVARLAFNEPYESAPMGHRIGSIDTVTGAPVDVEYRWTLDGRRGRLAVTPRGAARPIVPGSEEEYITDRHWGYTRQRDGGTVEYHVEHPRWNTWAVTGVHLEADLDALYGPAFGLVLRGPPSSAFLADGSRVRVSAPRRIAPGQASPSG